MKMIIHVHDSITEAEVFETATPGLLVARRAYPPRGWEVVHAASRTAVLPSYVKTKQLALEIAGKLAPLTDWTALSLKLANTPGLRERIRDAAGM